MQQGSLALPAAEVERLATVAAHAPLVLIVTLTRPAILTEAVPYVSALLADYGASDAAVLSVLSGCERPTGRLPFELPRSVLAVEAGSPDAGADTVDPLFPLGAGLVSAP
uniref:CAZy families GH3 protein n=1 Tax=uncultured Actinosynnema sp. TaxID=905025 RepID=A0A060CNQ9_9PSEU|nr:CAZy families GH3 protein [uncultured Actinosynnema sp.]